jgi:tetratricopeptide (TPR) repeat protein
MKEGQLQFRSAGGKLRSAWVGDIGLIVVDRGGIFADFNQAERFLASGEPTRAISRYRRSLRMAEGSWPDLIAARLVLACDAAAKLNHAVSNLIQVIRGRYAGPSAAARLIPKSIPRDRNANVSRAVELLDAALSRGPPEPQRVLLALVRYEILRRSGDDRATPAAQQVAFLTVPPAARSEQVYAIQLDALSRVLQDDATPEALAGLDNAIRDCPEPVLASFLLLKGQTLMRTASTRDDVMRASWPFLRVAIHFQDDARAADGLYGAALAIERLGRKDKAIKLLTECLGHKRLTDETRRRAETTLKRLQAAGLKTGGSHRATTGDGHG